MKMLYIYIWCDISRPPYLTFAQEDSVGKAHNDKLISSCNCCNFISLKYRVILRVLYPAQYCREETE